MDLSVVIPLLNEEESLHELYARIDKVCNNTIFIKDKTKEDKLYEEEEKLNQFVDAIYNSLNN